MASRLVTVYPFVPAWRLSGRPGAEIAALAALVDGDPDDLESLLRTLALTDRRIRDAAGAFAALPQNAQYRGPSAAAVMTPFLLPRESRFSTGIFGMLYGAETVETAAAEISYHHARRLRASAAPKGTTIVLALWAFKTRAELIDLRTYDTAIYHANDYRAAQRLGLELHRAKVPGALYSSVRRIGGECVGIFAPNAVRSMEKRDDWRLIWDGTSISEVLRSA